MPSVHDAPTLLEQMLQTRSNRMLVALAGLPGSGKSTLAAQWEDEFNRRHGAGTLVCLGMDGFHLTRAQLAAAPDPEAMLRRRGAPWTFDVAGLAAALGELKRAHGEREVPWPGFDHTAGDPVPGEKVVPTATRLIVVEGLYLLHAGDGWEAVSRQFDQRWYLDTPLSVATERLARRHMQAWGISQVEALRRIWQNDGRNATIVAGTRDAATLLLA